MLRARRITVDDVLQPLGQLALSATGVALYMGFMAVVMVALAIVALICAFEWAHNNRLLAPVTLGLLLGLVVIHFAGCATAPNQLSGDPRDPQIWRPTTPATYPIPR